MAVFFKGDLATSSQGATTLGNPKYSELVLFKTRGVLHLSRLKERGVHVDVSKTSVTHFKYKLPRRMPAFASTSSWLR